MATIAEREMALALLDRVVAPKDKRGPEQQITLVVALRWLPRPVGVPAAVTLRLADSGNAPRLRAPW